MKIYELINTTAFMQVNFLEKLVLQNCLILDFKQKLIK